MVKVVVDIDKCNGDAICIDICPVSVFELQDLGDKKISKVVNNDDCIVCMACVTQCPTQAIAVTE